MIVMGNVAKRENPGQAMSVSYKWVDSTRRVIGFTAHDDDPTLDVAPGWENATRETLAYFPTTRTYLGLYDFSQVRFAAGHLRYWGKHLETLAQFYSGHYAVVVSPRSFESVVEVISHHNNAGISEFLTAGIFPTREKAIAYLAQFA